MTCEPFCDLCGGNLGRNSERVGADYLCLKCRTDLLRKGRKERIRKDEFDPSNPEHFKLQTRAGSWRYYRKAESGPELYPYQEKAIKAFKENPRFEILTGVGKPTPGGRGS